MEAFKQFINNRIVRLVLATVCMYLAIQGGYRIFYAQSRAGLFRGVAEVVLWFSWALVNYLSSEGRPVFWLKKAVNVGILLVLVSWFIK